MQKMFLTTAAFLFVSGMAFAGSDHYGSDYNYGSGHDHSVVKPNATSDYPYPVDPSSTASMTTVNSSATAAGNSSFDKPAPGYGRGIWGR